MRHSKSFTFILFFALLLIPAASGATAVVVADTYISQTNPTVNYGAAATLNVGAGNSALVQLDLSGLQSLGLAASNIQKATLTVYVKTLVAGGLDFHLTNQSWFESTTTYNSFNLGLIGATFLANVPVTSTGFVTIDVTNQVRDWITGVVTNNGLIVTAAVAQPGTTVQLDSKENTATSHAAFIDVTLASVGPTGPSGPAGAAGGPGATGPSGPSGAQGIAGPSGATGATGTAGASGPSGPAGVAGPSGPSGAAGAAGPSGPSGAAGVAGPSGPSGAAGVAGPSGPSGAAGVAGPSGPSGAAGAQGPSGPSGASGPSGPSGPKGASGTDGTNGTNGAPGAPGSPGATGPSGPSGPSGPGSAASVIFSMSQINPGSSTWSMPFSGDGPIPTTNSPLFAGVPVIGSCTFNNLTITAVRVAGTAVQDQITATLVKNGSPTSMSVVVTSSATAFVYSTSTATSPTVSAIAGDMFGITFSETNTNPFVRIGVSARCQ